MFDALANAGSARLATLTVPGAAPSPFGVSSLVIVSRTEDVREAGPEPSAPFYVGRTLLYPNLGEPISLATASDLPFYFAVYGETPGLKVSAQLVRSGQVLADAPVTLPESKGTRVQHVGRVPVGALPAGTYELRIRVTDGTRDRSQSVFFTLIGAKTEPRSVGARVRVSEGHRISAARLGSECSSEPNPAPGRPRPRAPYCLSRFTQITAATASSRNIPVTMSRSHRVEVPTSESHDRACPSRSLVLDRTFGLVRRQTSARARFHHVGAACGRAHATTSSSRNRSCRRPPRDGLLASAR